MTTVEEAIKVVNEMVKQVGDLGIPTADMVLDCYIRVWSTMYINANGRHSGTKVEPKPTPAGTPEDDPIVAALKSMDGWGYPDKIAKALNTTESAIVPLIENAISNGKIYKAKKGYYSLNDRPKK